MTKHKELSIKNLREVPCQTIYSDFHLESIKNSGMLSAKPDPKMIIRSVNAGFAKNN